MQLKAYLRIQLCVPSNSFGVVIFVREATDAAQYALLYNNSTHEHSHHFLNQMNLLEFIIILYLFFNINFI